MSVSHQLPWSALELRQPEIPWDDLRSLAAAAVESADVRQKLMDRLEPFLDTSKVDDEIDRTDLAFLTIPAIFALAAERLDESGRRESAAFLIHALYCAGKESNDWLLEALEHTAGRFGPALVEPALMLLKKYGSKMESWSYICSLLEVAKDADEQTKQSVLEFCRGYIQSAPDRFEQWSSIDPPVWVLRGLDDKESLPLLREIQDQAQTGDLQEAIDILEEKPEALADRPIPYWEEPVEKWLPRDVEHLRRRLAEPEEEDGADDALETNYDEEAEAYVPSATRRFRSTGADTIIREFPRIGRNEPCPCGSGKKYKKCCGS